MVGLRSHLPQLHAIEHVVQDSVYATFIDKLCEVAMDVATHHDAFGIRELKHVLNLLIIHF